MSWASLGLSRLHRLTEAGAPHSAGLGEMKSSGRPEAAASSQLNEMLDLFGLSWGKAAWLIGQAGGNFVLTAVLRLRLRYAFIRPP